MRGMRSILALPVVVLLAAALALAAAGCAGKTPAGGQAKEPLVIGLVTSQTGRQAGTGMSQINGIQQAIDEWNQKGGVKGRPVKLVVEDDGSTPPGAVNAFNKIVSEAKPIAVILPNYGNFIMAMEQYIRQAGIPVISGASTVTITRVGNPWIFRVRTNDEIVGQLAAEYAVNEMGAKKIGIIHVAGEFGMAGAKVVRENLERLGVPPVGVEAYNPDDRDLTAQLLRLKNAGADLIIGWAYPPDAGLVMASMYQQGLKARLLGSPAYGMPEALKLAGEAANGHTLILDFVPTDDPKVQDWVKKIEARSKLPANFINSVYYDAVNILLNAVEKVGTDPQALRQAILDTQGYQGITGEYNFDPNGDGLHQIYITRVENGKPVLLKVIKAK